MEAGSMAKMLFTQLLGEVEMGGRGWIKQLVDGFPMAGNEAEIGGCPTQPIVTPPLSRDRR